MWVLFLIFHVCKIIYRTYDLWESVIYFYICTFISIVFKLLLNTIHLKKKRCENPLFIYFWMEIFTRKKFGTIDNAVYKKKILVVD